MSRRLNMVFLLSESALDTAQELGVLVHIAGVRLGRGERGEDQARRDGEEQALGHWMVLPWRVAPSRRSLLRHAPYSLPPAGASARLSIPTTTSGRVVRVRDDPR